VAPFLAACDLADKLAADAVALGNIAMENAGAGKLANDGDVGFVQLGKRAGRAFAFGAVFHFVCDIVRMRVPAKIRDAIIHEVSIVMARLHSWRAFANEGGQHKPVNVNAMSGNAVAQVHVNASIPVRGGRQRLAVNESPASGAFAGVDVFVVSRHRANVATIRDFVTPCEFRNGEPCFHAHMVPRIRVNI